MTVILKIVLERNIDRPPAILDADRLERCPVGDARIILGRRVVAALDIIRRPVLGPIIEYIIDGQPIARTPPISIR
jgi:hypothetical protein